MPRNFDQLLKDLNSATAVGSLSETYENVLLPDVLAFGANVESSPTQDNIAQWLRVYSIISGLAIEGAPEITERLAAAHPAEYDLALKSLPAPVQSDSNALILATHGPAFTFKDLETATSEIFASSTISAALSGGLPVLATFVATAAMDTSRVARYTGTLTVYDPNKNVIGTYSASTGGFVADYKKQNGPTPPGLYIVSNYRSDRTGAPGMSRGGISYSFDLSEVVPTAYRPGVYRSAFRIHPDGPPPGTHGCVGVDEDGATLRDCAQKLSQTLQSGHFQLLVSYGSNPLATS
ncbi:MULTISPECIES: L,D-transpeptidase family protein [unclassified Mesorhizobium]|uniref:L,D-transpeptidase family protein n=1 Tax=unclassified Mesorhizobium TaxID=325217 RepID=UPI0010923E06|nr:MULTISPECIES: L,D-transpeptidase family protein [unclassified Mesorhizobium]TGQ43681.1 hypothetical protein EN857_06210 [Mesorhizobium sp. M4B.F.Ca.ET.214.01.1.1]TGQ62496.1 hypothetical protein EN854_06215 [Mesorhizobium sp. M4B.F.Ca.ET.211.01.1.1]TGU39698.1 hypothetical protein EN793_06210 [Mesorhizobium sp. M4B.F.Ca.ET.150.01.1.1]TIX16172.1 MAG: murein L,D-transpeptidase [Mesorhizobium sp.]